MKIDGKNYYFDEPQNNIGINEITRNNKNLKSIFAYFDKNGDNQLDKEEIQTAFNIFSKLDNTAGEADGTISDDEINERLKIIPEEFDITLADYKNFMRSLASTNTGKKLANEIYNQISGMSLKRKTLELLSKIDETNIIELLREYNEKSPDEPLAIAINNEWGLGINHIKSKICKPLITRAKSLNIPNLKHSDYEKIENINDLDKYINNIVNIIIAEEIKIAESDSIDPILRDPNYTKIHNLVQHQLIKRIPKGRRGEKYQNLSELPQNLQAQYKSKAKSVTKMVIEKCRKYDIESIAPVVAEMFGIESGGYNFTEQAMKNPGGLYKGVMQVDFKTCQCIYSEGNKLIKAWHDAHFSRDDTRINELKKKYPTAKHLYEAIQTDVKLGLEVGIIALKAKIHEAKNSVEEGIAKYCGNNYKCNLSGIPKYLE